MSKTIYVDNTNLTANKRSTFLTESVVGTSTTLRVQSILGFESLSTSSGQILCIGELGQELTELIVTSSTTSPSAAYKEITLASALSFDHSQNTKVYIVDWNRVDTQWASTVDGTKSTLRAYPIAIQPDQAETLFVDTAKTSGYYFTRFNETVGNTNSDWSDPVPFGGYDDNSVAAIKQGAVALIGEEIDGNTITHEFLNTELWKARREYHNAPGKRPFRRRFNVAIATALTGSFRVELPTDVERPFTSENIYGVRIGTQPNMTYYDKKSWDFDWRNRPHSTLELPYVKGVSTSLWLANGGDFSGSPTINIEGMNVSATRITGSQNSFTITSHGNWSASGGSDAYENISYGLPWKFTVFGEPGGSSYVYFNMPIDTAYIGQNIYLDYYRTLVGYNSDADILDEPNYDMYQNYLAAAIKHRQDKGKKDITQDPDYKLWLFKKNEALSREVLETDIRIAPDLPNEFPY